MFNSSDQQRNPGPRILLTEAPLGLGVVPKGLKVGGPCNGHNNIVGYFHHVWGCLRNTSNILHPRKLPVDMTANANSDCARVDLKPTTCMSKQAESKGSGSLFILSST